MGRGLRCSPRRKQRSSDLDRAAILKRRLTCLALCAAVGSCGQAGEDESTDAAKFVAAHTAVEQQLRERGRAEYRNDKVGSYKEVICGEVNSTHGIGGKSGYQRYVSNGGAATVLEGEMDPGEFATVWDSMC